MTKLSVTSALFLFVAGCGESPAQRWSHLSTEEQQRRLAENLERGEIAIAPLEGDVKAVDDLSPAKAYRAFGELRFKDPTYSIMGTAIVRLYEIRGDKELLRDQTTECNLEQVEPGIYRFDASMEPISKPGRYSIRLKEKGIGDVLASREFMVK